MTRLRPLRLDPLVPVKLSDAFRVGAPEVPVPVYAARPPGLTPPIDAALARSAVARPVMVRAARAAMAAT